MSIDLKDGRISILITRIYFGLVATDQRDRCRRRVITGNALIEENISA